MGSGVMTFLKKLGQVLVNVAGVALGVGPILKPFLGSGQAAQVVTTGVNDLTAIGQVIAQVETLFNAPAMVGSSSAQKLAAAKALIAPIVKTSELVSGKKIANETLFDQACTEITQGVVDLLQSIDPNEVKTA